MFRTIRDIEGHVEINADKNATAGKIDVSNGSEH